MTKTLKWVTGSQEACREAQIIQSGIAVDSEEGMAGREGEEIQVYLCLDVGREVMSNKVLVRGQPYFLMFQNDFETSITL